MLTPYQSLVPSQRISIDGLIAQWWTQLIENGEVVSTFGSGAELLSEFYKLLTSPDRLFLFDVDEQGICLCFLVLPMLGAAVLTVWVAPRLRASKDAMLTLEDAYSKVFASYPTILGVTRQDKLRVHQHWGYTTLGMVPKLLDGMDAWIVVLTPETFAAAQDRRHEPWETPARARAASEK